MRKNWIIFILLLPFITFSSIKAVQKSNSGMQSIKQDSIYKIWKLKTLEPAPNFKGGNMVAVEKYDLYDLTKKGTLRYTVADPAGVFHSQQYKLIDNAIVFQFPNSVNNFVIQFKIAELSSDELKLIMHMTYNDKGKLLDEDFVQLVFETKDK